MASMGGCGSSEVIVEYWIEDRARTTHACVEHKLLGEIFTHIVINIPAISSDMYMNKSAVSRLGQTMRLDPNKPSSRKSSPGLEKPQ